MAVLPKNLVLAWQQLSHGRIKMLAAIAGVVVAVLLMLMQLGFLQAAYSTVLFVPNNIRADLVLVSPRTQTMFQSTTFARRLLYRVPSHPNVESVQAVYLGAARWRNPWDFREFPLLVYGFEPGPPLISIAGLTAGLEKISRLRDAVLFDDRSRDYYGPVPTALAQGERVLAELNQRQVQVVGVASAGVSFTSDGNVFTSDVNFARIFKDRKLGACDLGLIALQPGSDPVETCKALQEFLGNEVLVFPRNEFIRREKAYLDANAPIQFIFSLGAMVGFFIGFVIVYQILYSDVSHHLPQFATMKAVGFSDSYLVRVVLSEALILAVLGFVPGMLMAIVVYVVAERATFLPLVMTWERATMVFGLTLLMCGLSGFAAMTKLRTADPADVF